MTPNQSNVKVRKIGTQKFTVLKTTRVSHASLRGKESWTKKNIVNPGSTSKPEGPGVFLRQGRHDSKMRNGAPRGGEGVQQRQTDLGDRRIDWRENSWNIQITGLKSPTSLYLGIKIWG